MKTLVIGDVHGTNKWKDIEPRNYDKIVFLGDYVDSYTIDNSEMVYNLKNIIDFKKDYKNKVILLMGNHDNSYAMLYDHIAQTKKLGTSCSGFRHEIAPDLYKLYSENMDLFQATYQVGNYLFSHAGLSRQSYNEYFKQEYENVYKDTMMLSTYLNMLYDKRDERLFKIGTLRGGWNRNGGIFWADREETSGKYRVLNNYNQIVGHTPVHTIITSTFENGTITYCDTQYHNNGLYYELDLNFVSKEEEEYETHIEQKLKKEIEETEKRIEEYLKQNKKN